MAKVRLHTPGGFSYKDVPEMVAKNGVNIYEWHRDETGVPDDRGPICFVAVAFMYSLPDGGEYRDYEWFHHTMVETVGDRPIYWRVKPEYGNYLKAHVLSEATRLPIPKEQPQP